MYNTDFTFIYFFDRYIIYIYNKIYSLFVIIENYEKKTMKLEQMNYYKYKLIFDINFYILVQYNVYKYYLKSK